MLTQPLFVHSADQIIAWRDGEGVSAGEFLQDVVALVEHLPAHAYAVNLCDDRYHFLVSFAAIIVKGQANLLPPNHAPQTIDDVVSLYADCYCLTDKPELAQRVPRAMTLTLPPSVKQTRDSSPTGLRFEVPQIDADQLAAVAFTSGSTGQPSANLKTWGQLVEGTHRIQLGLEREMKLAETLQIVATVPPQHMYGLENSIMLPLVSGSSIHTGRPLFPQDISDALSAIPAPRALITTPVHLKSCVGSGLQMPPLELVVSATAPLDIALAAAAETAFQAHVLEIYGCTECGSLAMRRTTEGEVWQLLQDFSIACITTESENIDDPAKEQDCRVSAPHLAEQVRLHDEIELVSHDRFRLQGRKADMINIAGKRASLADLNIKLNQIEGVSDGVILYPEDGKGNVQRLIAIVAAPDLSEQQILQELKTRLDPAFLPRPIYKVERLPREATGKLPRHKINLLLDELRSNNKGTTV